LGSALICVAQFCLERWGVADSVAAGTETNAPTGRYRTVKERSDKRFEQMKPTTISDLLDLTTRLERAHIYYRLSNPTHGAVMIEVAVPNERWEIEIHADGEIGVEVFVSARGVEGPASLETLFARFTDSE
jgi:hypothetical protein